jgi:MYXO-CTERM domain-containing protein
MTATPFRFTATALLKAVPAAALALGALLASGPAAAVGTGEHFTFALSYDDMAAAPSIGSFTIGGEVSGHPDVFLVTDISVVIGPAGYAYDYDLPDAQLTYDGATDTFTGLGHSHAYTSDGDQLDLITDGHWKTDDFVDPHPACGVAHCAGFHYGTYVISAVSTVPEPGSLPTMLVGLAALAAWSRRRRTGQ